VLPFPASLKSFMCTLIILAILVLSTIAISFKGFPRRSSRIRDVERGAGSSEDDTLTPHSPLKLQILNFSFCSSILRRLAGSVYFPLSTNDETQHHTEPYEGHRVWGWNLSSSRVGLNQEISLKPDLSRRHMHIYPGHRTDPSRIS
jgi:hypothetical protein